MYRKKVGGGAHALIDSKMCPLENSLLAAGGSQGSGKGPLVAFCSSYPEVCRPCQRTSPSGSRSMPCQDLSSSRDKEANFSTAAKFSELNLIVRIAIVGAYPLCPVPWGLVTLPKCAFLSSRSDHPLCSCLASLEWVNNRPDQG